MTNKTKILSIAMTALFVAMPVLAGAATLYRQLDVGSRGSDVGSLQTYLAQDPGLYPEGLVTSYFGSLTSAAVSRFQTQNGIASVGRVGPITLVALNAKMGGSTTASNGVAPTITSLGVTPTNSGAMFNWNTSENAAAIIYYSTSPITMLEASAGTAVTISGTSFLVQANLTTSHSATLTGLQSNTVYNYVVYVRDGNGNETITWPSTFRTN